MKIEVPRIQSACSGQGKVRWRGQPSVRRRERGCHLLSILRPMPASQALHCFAFILLAFAFCKEKGPFLGQRQRALLVASCWPDAPPAAVCAGVVCADVTVLRQADLRCRYNRSNEDEHLVIGDQSWLSLFETIFACLCPKDEAVGDDVERRKAQGSAAFDRSKFMPRNCTYMIARCTLGLHTDMDFMQLDYPPLHCDCDG